MTRTRRMIPVQPYVMVDADGYESVLTQKKEISQFYEFSVRDEYDKHFQAVPDGSTDLVFGIGSKDVKTYIGGTVLRVKSWEFETGREYFGVRFQPGKALLPHGISISDVVNADLEIHDSFFSEELKEQLVENQDILERAKVFLQFYQNRQEKDLTREYDAIANLEHYIRNRIYESKGNITIRELAGESGYSECYVRRSFEKVHGISPKVFEKFVRFQNLLNSIHDDNDGTGMEELAMECGYYDQSHMMKDFKNFTGITPERYRGMLMENRVKLQQIRTQICEPSIK